MKVQQSLPAGGICMADSVHEPGDSIICRQCGVAQSPEKFRRRCRDREHRVRQCRSCHNYAERLRRYGKRSKEHARQMSKALTSVRHARTERELKSVTTAMVKAFGGLEGFAGHWAAHVTAALYGGGFAAFKHFDAVLRLWQHCEDARQRERSDSQARCSQMTEAELIAELAGVTKHSSETF